MTPSSKPTWAAKTGRSGCSMYLELQHVRVSYDKVMALKGVSLGVEQGEIVALIGANGAGKTTMLRAITGLVKPTEGEIWFDGHRLDTQRPERIVALGVSMVPEGRHVYPYMHVKDNLLMGAYRRRDRQGIRDDLERMFARFPRLRERLHQLAGSLSGGEQQMLAISRALMARPRLLLLDEPSLGLAPMVVREIANAIATINREDQVSVVLVEQNSRMALRISSRGYVLETGRIPLDGRSTDLLDNDHVRRLYLGA
jgi:branched-chain amino acid transport system ATP-binding protein